MQAMPVQDFVRENIRREAKKQGLNQRELARKSAVHYVTINRIFSGEMVPSLMVCESLAKALQVPVQNFFQEPVDIG